MLTILDPYIRALLGDLIRRRRLVVGLFAAIMALATVLGLTWPKTYTASTTILAEDKSIIQPLMQGAAVTTTVTDRAKIAREILFGRKMMQHVMSASGALNDKATELDKEQLSVSIRDRTKVLNVGTNLIRIEHVDSDPERAFRVVQKFGELFIADSFGTQSEESEAAFAFIDNQVKEYYAKVVAAEERLREARGQDGSSVVLTQSEVQARINAQQGIIEKTTMEIKEAENRKTFLERQLAGEAAVAVSLSRESQYLSRIAELQSQLELQRLSLHDTHPDVIRIKRQIEDLKETVAAEQARRDAAARNPRGNAAANDDSARLNPVYQQIRTELLQVQGNLESLNTRLKETRQLVVVELARQQRLAANQETIADLSKDYEVNRDIYQDLLKRREAARVSRSLDQQKQGLTLRIVEPAVKPIQPSGLRFMHFAIVGMLLAVTVPPGLVFGLQRLDQRVRSASQIATRVQIPVLVTIPHLTSPAERITLTRDLGRAMLIMAVTVLAVIALGLLRSAGLMHS
jgi:polysaccharide chain length determinant protein (PEP-CTERM system associated)